MTIFDDFLIRAFVAGLGIACAVAPLGCFVVWRRMAYFSDATAHASILGVVLSLAFSISLFAGTLSTALLMGILVMVLSRRGYANDTSLGVLAHSSLALGLVLASFVPNLRIDLMSYLFGDILAVGKSDLAVIWCGVVIIGVLMWYRWSSLILSTLNPDLARAEGNDPNKEQLILTVALAILVAVGIKVVGVLLISALLIIPAASARVFSESPERMMIWSLLLSCMSVSLGLAASYELDTPAGPTIVSAAAVIFALSQAYGFLKSSK